MMIIIMHEVEDYTKVRQITLSSLKYVVQKKTKKHFGSLLRCLVQWGSKTRCLISIENKFLLTGELVSTFCEKYI